MNPKQKKNNWSILITILAIMINTLPGIAQQRNATPAKFKVTYEFKHVEDTNLRDQPFIEDYFLYVNENSSLYRREVEESSEETRFVQGDGNRAEIDINSIIGKTAALFHSKNNDLQVNTHRVGSVMYQVRNTMPDLKWEFREERKTIDGFNVQLATTHFGGRVYEAWFTTEIPLSFGPWKLQGLPGLILEAKDTKEDIVFTFKGIEEENKHVLIQFPQGIKEVTDKEFEKFYVAFRENPAAFYQATSSPGTVVVAGGSTRAGRSRQARQYNNPMELDLK